MRFNTYTVFFFLPGVVKTVIEVPLTYPIRTCEWPKRGFYVSEIVSSPHAYFTAITLVNAHTG